MAILAFSPSYFSVTLFHFPPLLQLLLTTMSRNLPVVSSSPAAALLGGVGVGVGGRSVRNFRQVNLDIGRKELDEHIERTRIEAVEAEEADNNREEEKWTQI
jgi:hypothetical protein